MEEVRNEEVGEGFFRPPLYKQRYTAAATILKDERWSKDIRKVSIWSNIYKFFV